jgi:hypothetical protein
LSEAERRLDAFEARINLDVQERVGRLGRVGER